MRLLDGSGSHPFYSEGKKPTIYVLVERNQVWRREKNRHTCGKCHVIPAWDRAAVVLVVLIIILFAFILSLSIKLEVISVCKRRLSAHGLSGEIEFLHPKLNERVSRFKETCRL